MIFYIYLKWVYPKLVSQNKGQLINRFYQSKNYLIHFHSSNHLQHPDRQPNRTKGDSKAKTKHLKDLKLLKAKICIFSKFLPPPKDTIWTTSKETNPSPENSEICRYIFHFNVTCPDKLVSVYILLIPPPEN